MDKQMEMSETLTAYGTPIKATYDALKMLQKLVGPKIPDFSLVASGLAQVRATLEELAGQTKKLTASTTEALDAIAVHLADDGLSSSQKRARIRKLLAVTVKRLTKIDARHVEDYAASGSFEDMQQRLPVDEYKAGFVPEVSAHLEGGGQVVLNLFEHYVRLQSMEADGFTIDDPGKMNSESFKVTWEEAIADGYFRKYFLVDP